VRIPAETIETERLVLRPFRLEDAKRVQELAGDPAVAEMTDAIPHPYKDGVAQKWIAGIPAAREAGTGLALAICLKSDGSFVGTVSLGSINAEHRRAVLGYWIGRPYWNRGYCTEATRALVGYGFRSLGLNRVQAYLFEPNPASSRVLIKIGMRPEGVLRQHLLVRGRFQDLAAYGVLASEYGQAADGPAGRGPQG
jgi:ribosomal-protein-alanine N-acetyltransferase